MITLIGKKKWGAGAAQPIKYFPFMIDIHQI